MTNQFKCLCGQENYQASFSFIELANAKGKQREDFLKEIRCSCNRTMEVLRPPKKIDIEPATEHKSEIELPRFNIPKMTLDKASEHQKKMRQVSREHYKKYNGQIRD